MNEEMHFKFKANSYQSDSSNCLISVDFIFENKLKCLENVFIKPLNFDENTEIFVTLIPKSSISKDEIHIPNWIFKYWENERNLDTTNLEIEIYIINENDISECETVTISKLSKKLFFPSKIINSGNDNNTNNSQFQNKTPLNSIDWKDIIIRNANNKIIKLNSAISIFVSAHPCLFKIISINNEKVNKTKLYRINENTKFIFEREINLDKKIPWGLEIERQQLSDLLSYNEIENNLQKQLNIQKFNGIIINGAIGVGKNEVVKDVCLALDIPVYPLSILKMNWEYINNEETTVNASDSDNNKIYNYLHKVIDKAKLSAPSVVLISELDLLANGNNDSEINKTLILKDLEKVLDKIKDNNSIHIIGLTENKKFLPELFSKSQIFSNVINIDIPNRKEREIQLSYILKNIPLESHVIINDIEDEDNKNKTLAEIYAKNLSELTPGYVRNNLKQLCNFAIQHSFIRNDQKVTTEVDDLIKMMASLSIHENKENNKEIIHVNYDDFLYGINQIKPSHTIDFETKREKTSWSDIGGYKEIVEKIKHLVKWPLLYPETYTKLGVKPPSGLILYGPSGCGKTLMINALSSDYSINFVTVKGSEIMSKYLGESEHKIRKLFSQARKLAPCVLFFDELDSIGTKRNWSDDGTGGVDERVLSTMLNEMDGIQERQGIFIIGCTNRPDLIDDALLRPGRFDHLIYIDMPNTEDRLGILNTITQPYDEYKMKERNSKGIPNKKAVIDPSVNLSLLAQRTNNFTGADLVVLFRQAGINALHDDINSEKILIKHVEKALFPLTQKVQEREQDYDTLVLKDCYKKFYENHV